MTFLQLIATFAAFTAMWAALEWLASRFTRKPDNSRAQALLDDEQAAHDHFMRTCRRIGRMPE